MSTAAQKLWPDPPRTRPVGPREQIAQGTPVLVDDDTHEGSVWHFDHWMSCGRFRFAMLRCSVPSCRDLHVCGEHRLRVGA